MNTSTKGVLDTHTHIHTTDEMQSWMEREDPTLSAASSLDPVPVSLSLPTQYTRLLLPPCAPPPPPPGHILSFTLCSTLFSNLKRY